MKLGELRTVEGDVTNPQTTNDNEIAIIPHCCNNENIWGGGFVIALSKKWHLPKKVYENFCERNRSRLILGKVCYAKIDNHLVIANMIGQDGIMSEDNLKPIKYRALMNCMAEVAAYIEMIECQTNNPVVIHCPKFGSLRANGNWDLILELIRELWLENGIDVVIYKFKE